MLLAYGHGKFILSKINQDGAQSSVVFLLPNEVINLKFIDHLSRDEIQKFNQLRRSAAEKKDIRDSNRDSNRDNRDKSIAKKKQPKLSQRDLIDLMGTHRDTYKRVGGAIRRK